MAIDTSIYSQLLRPPKSIAEYDDEALKNQQNRLALQIQQTQFDDRARAIADGNKLRQVVSGFGADQTANYNSLLSAGRLDEAQKYQKTNADISKVGADTRESAAKTKEVHLRAVNLKLGQAKDLINTIQTPEQAALWVQQMYKDPDLSQVFASSGDTPEAAIGRIPRDPKAFADWKMQASLGADKLIEYTKPNANTLANNQTAIATNAATNATSRANTAANNAVSIRGQNMVDNRERLTPKGQIVQTDQGTMLVDPRTGTAKPVTAGGEALGPKLKQIPATVSKAIMENKASLRTVDRALQELEKYPAAFGAKNYLGDGIRQRTDPEGITARAYTADIGSLLIHDRSGAAVTASETPRLLPFIPQATDNPVTVKKKLLRFKEEYEAINKDINETYSKEQGFRAGGGAAKASGIDALLEKYGE